MSASYLHLKKFECGLDQGIWSGKHDSSLRSVRQWLIFPLRVLPQYFKIFSLWSCEQKKKLSRLCFQSRQLLICSSLPQMTINPDARWRQLHEGTGQWPKWGRLGRVRRHWERGLHWVNFLFFTVPSHRAGSGSQGLRYITSLITF